ncbi:hypothetical protein [Pseudoalteromonas mariniglutinosa]|uniref:hypothetical protein n=1 Tax=Pseudoalteromonas mariniglutinosa TaxID=206042 RepID=UPI00384CE706
MFFSLSKVLSVIVALLLLTACNSGARYHELQSARLNECSHMADKEYHACVKRQQDGYQEFKAQQAKAKNDEN